MIPEFPDLVNVLYFLVVGKPLYLEESTWDTMVIKHGNGKCGPASQFFPMIFPCFATQQQVPGFQGAVPVFGFCKKRRTTPRARD